MLTFQENASAAGKKAWAAGKHDNAIHRNGRRRAKIESRGCAVCGAGFECKDNSKRKTCGKPECKREATARGVRANPNCGGESNYRRYRYKDILFDSAWELEIAQWMDGVGMQWIRDKKIWFRWTDQNGTIRRYHPDFYLPSFNIYLDPKNKFLLERDAFKLEAVKREHGINLVWGSREEILVFLQNLLG
jgi:hypothetical protein